MNIGLHHRAQGCVDHPMPFQRSLARELARQDPHMKMAAPVSSAGMPGVSMAVVSDIELVGRESGFQTAAN